VAVEEVVQDEVDGAPDGVGVGENDLGVDEVEGAGVEVSYLDAEGPVQADGLDGHVDGLGVDCQ